MELYKSHKGYTSDKWDRYLVEYERLLRNRSSSPISLLEIGIQNGGSLLIWADYFPQAVHIIGCDTNELCKSLIYENELIDIVIGDATLKETKDQITSITSKFDIIIDDGSHTSSDIIKTFIHFFPTLENSGVYIIEDLHCSYWKSFEGGLFQSTSSINFFKSLVDCLNHEHWGINLDRVQLLEHYGLHATSELEQLLSEVHSIEFINSLCVITRRPAIDNLLGARHIGGTIEPIARNLHVNGKYSVPPPQSDPTVLAYGPADCSASSIAVRIAELELEIATLKSKLIE
jgi:hypothetical protein